MPECSCCGESIMPRDIMYALSESGEEQGFCEGCYDSLDSCPSCDYRYVGESCPACSRKIIRPYGKTRPHIFLGKGGPFMGVELEVDGVESEDDRESCAKKILSISNYVEIKEDASLDNGFEIVSQPATCAYHVREFPWQRILSVVRDYGFKAHSCGTCGMHIHIGRKSFSPATCLKMTMDLIYGWKYYSALARRDSCNYARKKEIKGQVLGAMRDGKRDSVNWCPEDTVELRLFRGTTNIKSLFGTLEFCDLLVRYAETQPIIEAFTLHKDPTPWWAGMKVLAEKHGYQRFLEYCERRGV